MNERDGICQNDGNNNIFPQFEDFTSDTKYIDEHYDFNLIGGAYTTLGQKPCTTYLGSTSERGIITSTN